MPANILIVEDEWLIAEDYASVLRGSGHRIVGPCATVEAALSTIGDSQIDVALLDMDLSGEKSFAVAERLREQRIPFVFLSGHAAKELPHAMRAQRVISKPVARATLLAAVEKMYRSG